MPESSVDLISTVRDLNERLACHISTLAIEGRMEPGYAGYLRADIFALNHRIKLAEKHYLRGDKGRCLKVANSNYRKVC